ncbi:MAG: hypothetical protein HYZ92_04705 [Candidatus Omnitrophica bacterium]|nr:hypothetical protein [Candidatus Omnitrophota bacterium]
MRASEIVGRPRGKIGTWRSARIAACIGSVFVLVAPGWAEGRRWEQVLRMRQEALGAEGWVVEQRAPLVSSSRGPRLAAIWARWAEGYRDATRLEVYELSEPGPSTTFRILGQADGGWLAFEPPSGNDLTGDGVPELVVRDSTGGNCWGCAPLRIFTLEPERLRELRPLVAADHSPRALQDLDADGRPELVAIDTRWEFYQGFCHAGSPGVMAVYAWRGGRYVEVSPSFPSFFEREIGRYEGQLSGLLDDEAYLSHAVSIFLNYAAMGHRQMGWVRLHQLLATRTFAEGRWAKTVQAIKQDLK